MKTNFHLAAFFALLTGCGADSDPSSVESPSDPLSFQRISCPNVSSNTSLEKEKLSVIKNAQEFREIYLVSDLDSQAEAPEVNFEEQTVIAIHLGAKPSSGYSVNVMEVLERDGVVDVNYEVSSPSNGCEVDTAITYPYCFFAIEKTDKEFVFSATNTTKCARE